MSSALRIVVTGLIGQHPLGGVAWDYLQYPLGLAGLGHDVYYLEDSGEWPYNVDGVSGRDFAVADCRANLAGLRDVMSRFGFADRWAFRCPIGSEWFGLPDSRRAAVLASADLLLNISGTLARPARYRQVPRLVYLDTDPVFTQIKLADGSGRFRARVDAHDAHFSLGERVTSADVPPSGHDWRPTRQPIVLSQWRPLSSHRDVYTTVMNWASYAAVVHEGVTYGQKDVEFKRMIDLPARVAPSVLEVAVKRARRRRRPIAPTDRLRRHGWRIVDPATACPDLDGYRDYVRSSKAEWSVAKNGYVTGRPGWFSCRSACYLAAGRPVIVQDTGFADVLPVGLGILTFDCVEQAVESIREVDGAYARHATAAREIAAEYFDAAKVLTSLVERAGERMPAMSGRRAPA